MFNGVRAKSYNIYAIGTVGTAPVFITSTTKTNYLVPTLLPSVTGIITSVIVKPVNSQGEGNSVQISIKG
jgi:hypothetical protein